jgi:dimethylaniline monooxygenase (N-oxide forming)
MKIAIIGAGFAGLSSAKVLRQAGHDVVVLEKAPDVGGVWSATRRYPGVRTQNDKGTYAFSDYPMPRSYPEWPSGEQVQAYLVSYATRFELDPVIRFSTEVVSAALRPGENGWTVSSRGADGETSIEEFDHLVVANGIFSEPLIPPFAGVDDFTAAGGRLCASSEFHDVEDARGKHVLVVGYGKSSCDVSIPVSDVAASTNLVARELLWKMPKKLGGVVNYKFLMLTRLGEGLFRYLRPHGVERFLHGPGNGLRKQMLGSVQAVATRQLKLGTLGLVPGGSFEDIARSTVSLATDDFYERVAGGRIVVHRDRTVTRLLSRNGAPHAELSDGTVRPADLVVCGTGFRQAVSFFDEALQERVTDGRGNFELYRQIHPLDVPHLSFAGYNSSFFSPLSAEMAAVWIAAKLAGEIDLSRTDELRSRMNQRLRWMEERTHGQHSRGTNIIPFSMHNVDEVLDEIGLNVGPLTRAAQWVGPVNPGSYRKVTPALVARLAKSAGTRGRSTASTGSVSSSR